MFSVRQWLLVWGIIAEGWGSADFSSARRARPHTVALAMPMGSRPSGELANKSLLSRRGLQLLAKGVTSAESTTDHMTLCSYVNWGGGGCPQATIARVKHSPSGYLVKNCPSGKCPSILLWESKWERELKIKRYLTPITKWSHVMTKPANCGGAGQGTPPVSFPMPTEIDQTVQSSLIAAAYLMENYILNSSVELGLGFIQLPCALARNSLSDDGHQLSVVWGHRVGAKARAHREPRGTCFGSSLL